MKRNELDIVFVLDKSGSMSGSEKDTIGGYNSFLSKERKKNSNSLVTTVLFDNNYEKIYDRVNISNVKKLTEKEYYVGGCTALYDAIGKTITELDRKHPEKVLFVITTDGMENASQEYNKNNIKKLIESHKNYEFIFLGAGIDSYSEGASIGIKKENISNYSKSRKGISNMFNAVGRACEMMCEDSLDASWKSNLENYIEDNKEY